MRLSGYTLILILVGCLGIVSCRKDGAVLEGDTTDPLQPGPADPPYRNAVDFPSGLRLDLITDGTLTTGYPNPAANPFGATQARHFERVSFFIDLPRAPVWENVSANFRLSEYTTHSQQRGGTRAYVDPQMAFHVQEIRSGLGRPILINSAYRTPEHNEAVGGPSFSRHIYGDAVDIDIDQTLSDANRLAQEVFNEALDVGVDFVLPLSETSVSVGGDSRVSWVHMDDRGF